MTLPRCLIAAGSSTPLYSRAGAKVTSATVPTPRVLETMTEAGAHRTRDASQTGALAPGSTVRAVGLDPAERRPALLSDADLIRRFDGARPRLATGSPPTLAGPAGGGSLARFLAAAVGLLLLVETFLAWHFGKGRG